MNEYQGCHSLEKRGTKTFARHGYVGNDYGSARVDVRYDCFCRMDGRREDFSGDTIIAMLPLLLLLLLTHSFWPQ